MARTAQISKPDVPTEGASTAKRGLRKAIAQVREVQADPSSLTIDEDSKPQASVGSPKMQKIEGTNRKRRNYKVLHGKILKELLEKAQWELNLLCIEAQTYHAQFAKFQEELGTKK